MNEAGIFKITRYESGMTIRLSSTFENIDRTAEAVVNFLSDMGVTEKKSLFATGIGLREGLTNAVRHGHLNNPSKVITLNMGLEKSHLTIEIEDSGRGFNWKEQEKKIACIKEDHGRGISIIKQYFTTYRYNEAGNKLTMTKIL